ncbi:hypothetical protein LEN26_000135 [Aphanomyces euteiches]|nr:hypothetical protein AeMF1_011264 [Aphanomyces euteiches]KAH9164238.1 hypothetical protein LEN26_000135 [Aphanomyces euteiches]KAH9182080.1 hypothetical protein AeNC1_015942 [Aphanomyces euteiches]
MRVVERLGDDRPTSGAQNRDAVRPPQEVDRDVTCPTLVRVFCNSSHYRPEDFNNMQAKPLANEYHVYTWLDATLREIAELVQDANEEVRKRNRLAISLVYPDRRGKFIVKKSGLVNTNRKGPDDDKTLASLGFQNGDFLDVAILS